MQLACSCGSVIGPHSCCMRFCRNPELLRITALYCLLSRTLAIAAGSLVGICAEGGNGGDVGGGWAAANPAASAISVAQRNADRYRPIRFSLAMSVLVDVPQHSAAVKSGRRYPPFRAPRERAARP